jgi:preprotein translocase subunit YajC
VSVLILIVLAFFAIWLIVIRPNSRRRRDLDQQIATIDVGDEIVTAGGLYGHVLGVGDDELLVEIAHGVNVRIARRAVAGVVGPDEEDDEDEELEEPAAVSEEPAAVSEAPQAAHEAATDETPR